MLLDDRIKKESAVIALSVSRLLLVTGEVALLVTAVINLPHPHEGATLRVDRAHVSGTACFASADKVEFSIGCDVASH